MKTLSVVGTAAMFLVGGGIILHGNAPLHHVLQVLLVSIETLPAGSALTLLTTLVANAVTGLIAGGVLVALLTLFNRIRTREGGDAGE